MVMMGRLENHRNCQGCNGSMPLTLADRERIHGRSFRQHDQTRDWHEVWCTNCLADLPHGLAALSHVCDEQPPAPVKAGDVVRYHGSFTEYRGTIWKVTHVDGRGRLTLFDVDRALRNVHASSVTAGL